MRRLQGLPAPEVEEVCDWTPPAWCDPERGCLRVEQIEKVVPKNWDRLTSRQQRSIQKIINELASLRGLSGL